MTYIVQNNVLFQKDYRIAVNQTVAEYALSNISSLDPNLTIGVAAINGKLFELNLSAAIIFEEISLGKNPVEIASIFSSIYDGNNDEERERIKTSIEHCINTLLSIGLVKHTQDNH